MAELPEDMTTMASAGRLLVFEVAGRRCAVPLSAVEEVAPLPALERLPGQASFVAGYFNLRGRAVAVLPLGRLFDGPPSEPGVYSTLIVMRSDSHSVALLADRVMDILSPPEDAFLPVGPNDSFNACALAEVQTEHGIVHLLSPGRLLLESERKHVAEMQERAEQCLRDLEAGHA